MGAFRQPHQTALWVGMGQHSSLIQLLLLGILTAECLPVKKLQEFFEGCIFMLKLSPNTHSCVAGWTEL